MTILLTDSQLICDLRQNALDFGRWSGFGVFYQFR